MKLTNCRLCFINTRRERRVVLILYTSKYTVYDGVHHTPLGRFAMLDISTAGIIRSSSVGAKNIDVISIYLSEFSELPEEFSFGIGTLLVGEQSTPGGTTAYC